MAHSSSPNAIELGVQLTKLASVLITLIWTKPDRPTSSDFLHYFT
uniref:Uncharacterized protein n=1 Tax=Arundo donax TaxID=35708 RepID=A0A0A8YI98_ARUDO